LTTTGDGRPLAPPVASSEAISRKFSRQRSFDTTPELLLRRALHRRGLRYRVHVRPVSSLRRTADVVFPRARVAVEMRGCFWHGCPLHRTIPSTNHQWWADKLANNRRRDAETEGIWRAEGWTVVIVWEHDNPEYAATQITTLVAQRTSR